MPATRWGIDAASPFGAVIGTTRARLGNPGWIGRYLYQIQGVSSGLTREEIADIHAAGMGLLMIANDTSATSVAGTFEQGRGQGLLAAATAKGLGAPPGCAISVDWETNMSPSVDNAHGIMVGIAEGGFVAVIYLNPNVGAHVAAYQGARAAGGKAGYWPSEPELNVWFDTVRTDFTPALIPGYEGEAWYHQYSENNLGGTIDLDVATDHGLSLLWGTAPPVPPAPKVYEVSVPGALKTQPNHTSPTAIDPRGKPVFLELGAVVIPTGKSQHTDTDWTPVRLPTPSPVHGFFLSKSITPDTDV